MIGAAANLTTEMLVDADQQVATLIETIDEFKNPDIEKRDARKEAVDVLTWCSLKSCLSYNVICCTSVYIK